MTPPTFKQALTTYGHDAYLLTVSEDGPHTSNVSVSHEGAEVSFFVSRSARKNIDANSNVSVFWPPQEDGGYAIILNGCVTASKTIETAPHVSVAVSKAVYHRPGKKPAGVPGPCRSDCISLAMA